MTVSSQLMETIQKHPNEQITITVRRDGADQAVKVTPALNGSVGRIGVSIADEMKTINPSFFEAIGMSVKTNVRSTELIFQTIWGLVTRETSPKQLMGPVAISPALR